LGITGGPQKGFPHAAIRECQTVGRNIILGFEGPDPAMGTVNIEPIDDP